MCSDHRSANRTCRLRKASSRASRLSLQVGCGLYLPGRIGIKSLMGLPKIHCTGKSFVSRVVVFRYWSTARRCSLFVSRLSSGLVLLVMRRMIVFTPLNFGLVIGMCGYAPEFLRERFRSTVDC